MFALFRIQFFTWLVLAAICQIQLYGATDEKKASITKPESINFDQLRARKLRPIDSKASLELLTRALAKTENPQTQSALLKGILSGLEGRRDVGAPAGWDVTKSRLSASGSGEVKQLTQRLSQIFGDEAATEKALSVVRDPRAPVDARRSALKSLITQKNPQLKTTLESLLDDPALRIDAIRGYGTLEDKNAPRLILSRYPKFDFPAKRAAVETLATRKNYATDLLTAIEKKTVPKADIPAYIARSLSAFLGEKFTSVYGDIEELSKDKAELIAKYKNLLSPERLAKANPARGRAVFQTSCSACHSIYGEGGVIGPDLTGSNRGDIDYILLNMIDPSADIPDAYKLVTIHTKSGQVLGGTVSEEDDQRVVLNLVGQKMTVMKGDVASREVSPLSMMPEGLLPTLKDEQVIDLVKYLQTTTQVNLPK